MNRVSIRQFCRGGSVKKIKEWVPCEIVADGEVIAVVLSPGKEIGTDSLPTEEENCMKNGQ